MITRILILALLIAHCHPGYPQDSWPRYTGNNQNTNYSKSSVTLSTPKLKWEVSIGPGSSAPIISQGLVFVTLLSSRMAAYDLQTGSCAWNVAVSETVLREPVVGEGKIVVGDFDGVVYALDAKTGALIWRHKTNMDRTVGCPIINNGIAYIGADKESVFTQYGEGALYAFDMSTGKLIWKFADALDGIGHSLFLADGKLLFTDAKNLYALNALTGEQLWIVENLSGTGHHPHVPILVGTDVYVDYGNSRFIKVDLSSGKTKWLSKVDFTINTSFSYVNGKLYYGSSTKLKVLDIVSYEWLWEFDGGLGWIHSDPLVTDDLVIFGTYENLVALHNITGEVMWRFPGNIRKAPAVANGIVVVSTSDGTRLFAIE